jgi:NADH-quinone oxidoreductase subunit E
MRVLSRERRDLIRRASPTLNGFSLLVLIVLVAGIPMAFRAGMLRERRDARARGMAPVSRSVARADTPGAETDPADAARPVATSTPAAADALAFGAPDAPSDSLGGAPPGRPADAASAALDSERARLIRAAERENAALRGARRSDAAEIGQLREFAEERRGLLRDLADARGEVARYRTIVVDLEDDAPPPLLDLPNAPDDLKLIVGIGPVLERMLQQLGIGSYRQIARWSEHDIDAFDARLPEFRGRIRRDTWVTQARELHHSKYGERP